MMRGIEKYGWGKVLLTETVKVQNLFAWHGIAPRVYALVVVNGEYPAQVTEFVFNQGDVRIDKARKLMNLYNVDHISYDTVGHQYESWVGDQMVDFGGMRFVKPNDYLKNLTTIARTLRGVLKDAAYQSVPELDLSGLRDLEKRFEIMGLNREDFKGKTVLDVGCDLGGFSRYASGNGALRVVGVDHRNKPSLAFEISNWLGYWNIDFIRASLPGEVDKIESKTGIDQFDIVFALAVIGHVGGYAEWLPELCKDGGTFWLEGHGKQENKHYQRELRKMLDKDFTQVEFIGMSEDYYERPVFRCVK